MIPARCVVCNASGKYQGIRCHGCGGTGWVVVPGNPTPSYGLRIRPKPARPLPRGPVNLRPWPAGFLDD